MALGIGNPGDRGCYCARAIALLAPCYGSDAESRCGKELETRQCQWCHRNPQAVLWVLGGSCRQILCRHFFVCLFGRTAKTNKLVFPKKVQIWDNSFHLTALTEVFMKSKRIETGMSEIASTLPWQWSTPSRALSLGTVAHRFHCLRSVARSFRIREWPPTCVICVSHEAHACVSPNIFFMPPLPWQGFEPQLPATRCLILASVSSSPWQLPRESTSMITQISMALFWLEH